MRFLRSAVAGFLFLMLFLSASSFAFCDSFLSVSIQGRYEFSGNNKNAPNGTFILSSVDSSPMPEDSSDGLKVISASAGSVFSFGEISFERPGIYEYTVMRSDKKRKGINIDESVFNVRIDVLSDGSSLITYEKNGEEGKSDEICYTDRYEEPLFPVKTGDDTFVNGYILSLSMALTGFIVCLIIVIKQNNSQTDGPRRLKIKKEKEIFK